VIEAEPHVGDVVPALVGCDFRGREVVVVVDDGLFVRYLVEKSA